MSNFFFRFPFLIAFFSALVLLTSCNGNNDSNAPSGRYSKGVFVVNEGSNNNGSVSFFYVDSNKVVNDVYGRENNGLALGVFVQSMYLYQDKAYVCVDNAGKLNVMDANTFKQLAAISLQQPNSMVADGNTGYVTEWANVTDYNNPPKGNVAFIDLQTNSLITRVTTDGALPRDIRFLNGRLYVINSAENSIAIINVTNRRLERKVITGDSPNSMVFDRNNNLWVLCGSFGGTNAVLIRYSVNGDNLTEQSRFGFSTSDASRLIVNSAGDRLYYNFNGSVFSQSITATSLSTTPFLNRDFYGIGIDPTGNAFYGADAGNFVSPGKMIRYFIAGKSSLTNADKLDSAMVGVGPNGFIFR